jgi:hypothetical protein
MMNLQFLSSFGETANPLAPLGMTANSSQPTSLEAIPQGELHDSRLRQRAAEGAEHGGGSVQLPGRLRQGGYVEANRVGDVEHFPAEL